MTVDVADADLKQRHRTMWGKGDYGRMVETFLLPVGQRLVKALDLGPGVRVLDVAAGTGNASIPAAQRGATVTASDLTPDLLAAGQRRPEAAGLDLEWVEADAEHLPFEDGAYDVVMSSIGVMFAPHHQAAADEMVRVCRPGGRIALLSWTPSGMIGDLFKTMGPFAPPSPPGAQPPPRWGDEAHVAELFGDRVSFDSHVREDLHITVFPERLAYAEHFKACYGPTITTRAYAETQGTAGELDRALEEFCDRWNRGTGDAAVYEQEYLLSVGTRTP